jgi:hypothetical protein
MSVAIVRYTDRYVGQVKQFNQRMTLGGYGEYQLPIDLRQFEDSADGPIPWEGWLAVQDDIVRGGYLLRRQDFSFGGDIRNVAFYNLSVSEGAIDRAYSPVSMRMIATATDKVPLMFALGMGGVNKQLPKFLRAFGWKLHEIPFLFRLVHPGRAARNIVAIRTTPLRRAILDVAAFTGGAWVGISALQALRRRRRKTGWHDTVRYEETDEFGPWADSVWNECANCFAMIGVRDACNLNALYPQGMPRIARLKMRCGHSVIGWAVVLNTQMRNHKQFGDLHVGTLVDCLAPLRDAPLIVEAAERFLENKGVDIVVSNQCHESWRSALLDLGFLEGPSNFVLAVSRGLSELLKPFDHSVSRIHLTRGDGDGPIHL